MGVEGVRCRVEGAVERQNRLSRRQVYQGHPPPSGFPTRGFRINFNSIHLWGGAFGKFSTSPARPGSEHANTKTKGANKNINKQQRENEREELRADIN